MQLETNEIAWVMRLSGMDAAIRAADKNVTRKQELIAQAWSVLDSKVTEIKVGEDFTIEMKNSGLSGFLRQTFKVDPETQKSMSKDGNPDKQFDTGADLSGSMGLTQEQATALTRAHAIIVEQVDKLRAEKDLATNKPLFADVEIAKEIWEPLMRRKIIPENAIASRYSDVARTFDAASEGHHERLAAYSESVSSDEGLAKKLGLGSSAIEALGAAATGTLTIVTAVAPGMANFKPTEALAMTTAATVALQAPLDIGAALLKDKRKLTATNVQAIARTLAGVATGWVTAGISSQFPTGSVTDQIGRELGKAIDSGIQIALSGTTFAAKVFQGKYDEAFNDVADIVGQCFACAGSAMSFQNTQWNDKMLADIGTAVADALKVGNKLARLPGELEKSKDPLATLTAALQEVLKSAVETGATFVASERRKERFDDVQETQKQADEAVDRKYEARLADDTLSEEDRKKLEEDIKSEKEENAKTAEVKMDQNEILKDEPADKRIEAASESLSSEKLSLPNILKLAQTNTPKQLEKLFAENEELKNNEKIQKLMLAISQKREAEIAEATKSMDEVVAADAQDFRALLSDSQGQDSDVDAIEILILQIRKDQMIIGLAEGMASMTAAAVAAFLPPASIAVDAVQLAIAMRKAIQHLLAWNEWNDNVQDAKSAMSVQVSAMANRAGISKRKGIEEAIKALEAAIKLCGDSLGTAGGPFAPAGIAVARGTSVVSTIKDVILEIYAEKELEDNWKKFEKARKNPDDRKAIRAAISSNATLAKYTIAYGAVVAEDAVAKNALKKCGLSTKVLQSESTNVQKVVTFLEALYPDDPIVLKRLPDAPNWHPGPIELSATSVAAFSFAGQHKANPPFGAPINPNVAKGLLAVEASRETAAAALLAWETAVKAKPHDPLAETDTYADLINALKTVSSRIASVRAGLITWKPTDKSGNPHKDGAAYKAELMQMVEAQFKKAQQEISVYEDEVA